MSENTTPENENTATETPTAAAETAATEKATNAAEAAKTEETDTAALPATSAVIKIEGQEFPLDAFVAADDNLLKTALSPHYPSIKNAQISRETRAGQLIVSIVKKAEHKGIFGSGQ